MRAGPVGGEGEFPLKGASAAAIKAILQDTLGFAEYKLPPSLSEALDHEGSE